MSKWGFDRIIKKLPQIEKAFLKEGMTLAQMEFKSNFDGQKNSESGVGWDMVVRGVPPPILDVTGELRKQTLSKGNIKFYAHKAVLYIDPIDGKGRGYASYHMIGTNKMNKRIYVTQSSNLDRKQKQVLLDATIKAFN